MSKTEEARAALEAEQGECWHERSGAEGRNHIMAKADAYALAGLEEYRLSMHAAAPELLEALRGVVRSAGYESGEAEPSLCELNVSISSLDQARTAIEKVVDSRVSGAAK